MGSLRLILAVFVLLYHSGYQPFDFILGTFAVVSFFLMSGYVTTALTSKYYPAKKDLRPFLADRALRLFPQFLFYVTIALLLLTLGGATHPNYKVLTLGKVALNYLMLPLGYYMYFLNTSLILPPSWSLGLEATFYIAFHLLSTRKVLPVASLLSFAVFSAAMLGYLDADVFGYRLLAGTLFIFDCGRYVYLRNGRVVLSIWIAVASVFADFMIAHHGLVSSINFAVLTGILIGVPAVWFLSKIKYRSSDEMLGNLSYGVYLNHYCIILAAGAMHIPYQSWVARCIIIAISLPLGWVTYLLIERPVLNLRHRLRARVVPKSANTVPTHEAT